MRNIKKPFVIAILLIFLCYGCKKPQCYMCYVQMGWIKAIKGSDTVVFYAQVQHGLTDSINGYKGQGYRIDTIEIYNEAWAAPPDLTCNANGANGYNTAIADGFDCSPQ